jgi:hypothetical protein
VTTGKADHPVPAGGLAWHYRFEAETCFKAGAHVATILMTQLAFEELLRAYYRSALGYGGRLSNGTPVAASGFADLIREAEYGGMVSDLEAIDLQKLRNIRNPYVHTRDKPFKPEDWSDQMFKVEAPGVLGLSVEDEAEEAIRLLGTLWPKLARRQWGLEEA